MPRTSGFCRKVDEKRAAVTGYFTTNFTVKELKRLSAVQPLPFRDHSYDEKGLQIETIADIFAYFLKVENPFTGPGLYMELKHPQFHSKLVRSMPRWIRTYTYSHCTCCFKRSETRKKYCRA
jgi:glycerophosphoryl diester phosphodiesterase